MTIWRDPPLISNICGVGWHQHFSQKCVGTIVIHPKTVAFGRTGMVCRHIEFQWNLTGGCRVMIQDVSARQKPNLCIAVAGTRRKLQIFLSDRTQIIQTVVRSVELAWSVTTPNLNGICPADAELCRQFGRNTPVILSAHLPDGVDLCHIIVSK